MTVPSSTSSFREVVPRLESAPPHAANRVPRGGPWRTWLGAAALFLIVLAGLEVFWRAQGFVPSVTDDEALWAYHRGRVENAPQKTVLFLGRSRIQQQFVPEAFQEVCPGYDYIQLALGGKHPIATLRDIAENTSFQGVVVCSLTTASLLPELWDQQRPHLDYYHHKWGSLKKNARLLKGFAQCRLAVMAPELLPQRALPDLLRGTLEPQFLLTHFDRTQTVDYHAVDIEEFTRIQQGKIERNLAHYVTLDGYQDWPKGLQQVHDIVRYIQQRGGEVVFLRAPTTGAYRERETEHFPRERFWDAFAEDTPGVALHFEDIPGMRDLVCAEGTHLYHEDAKTFTRVLAETLREHGVLE